MAKQGAENLEKPMTNQGFWPTGFGPTCAVPQGSAVDAGLLLGLLRSQIEKKERLYHNVLARP